MKKDFFFVLDQGTTSHKLAVFDRAGGLVDLFEDAAPQSSPHADGFSCDILKLSAVSDALIAKVIAKYGERLFAFGFANQGETVVAWDKKTGEPLSMAVSWQCQDAQGVLNEKRERFGLIHETSGLIPSPYFSAAKFEKLIRVNASAREAQNSGRLALGTLDTWMISRWTGGKSFVTDPTTACRTQLYDTFEGRWSEDLVGLFNLRREFLPEVVPNHQFEIACDRGPFREFPLPLVASLCDQPAALIGHGGLSGDRLKVTLGTGAFVDLSLRGTPPSSDKLLTSVLHEDFTGTAYYLEGGVLSFATAIEEACRARDAKLEDALPLLGKDHGIRVLPALSGLGAPHFRSEVRTIVEGLKPAHEGRYVLAATLHGLAFRIREILDEMAVARPLPGTLRVDGGLSGIAPLMQILSDVSGKTVVASDHPHVTAEGVARTILNKIGLPPPAANETGSTFQPREGALDGHYAEWKSFVQKRLKSSERP